MGCEIPLREAAKVWARIGVLGFGGPAGQIALMHAELVEKRRWIDEERFLHALNYCMLLPGPEATQLATYIGWMMHRTRGGVIAGALFVLPGACVLLALSALYAGFHDLAWVAGLFFGLKAAVLAIVVEAVIRVGKRALAKRPLALVAAAAFVALFVFGAPFPAVVLGAGVLGLVASRVWPAAFEAPRAAAAGDHAETVLDRMAAAGDLAHTRPSGGRAARVVAACLAAWGAPLALAAALAGPSSVYVKEGLLFSKAAVVTFGGAYAVLAYIAQQAVEVHGWLAPGEMVDGLGLAETTPGPLILVVQFVGFLGAYRSPGSLPPMAAGALGTAMTLWCTFVPCFLWIFLGAPFVESLRASRALRGALATIGAAVVGVILDLTLWFAAHVAFREVHTRAIGPLRLVAPTLGTIDPAAIALAAAAMVAMLRFKLSMPRTLAACAVVGLFVRLLLR